MFNVNLNYDCESLEELLHAIERVRAAGIAPSVSTGSREEPLDKAGKGPNEIRYNQEFGKFRYKNQEQALFESGKMTREEIVATRLSEKQVSTEPVTDTLPQDDGGSVLGDD